ncbi:hypothetical protein [Sulfitobacter sp.]|uniref:hypothetical protein n=1 Tax=Sulfitobacter sp. TaxID=1903071 RepID=UPI003003A45A
MQEPDRLRRPVPERTKPHRGILGALIQKDGTTMASPLEPSTVQGSHPLTPGHQADPPEEGVTRDAADFISEGVRAASKVADAHILEGQQTAQSLGASVLRGITRQKDAGNLLGNLTSAYSDLAAVWMEVAQAIAGQITEGKPAAPETTAPAAHEKPPASIALVLDCARRVETRLDMFRSVSNVLPQPLVSSDAEISARVSGVSFTQGQGGQAGILHVLVPADATPGRYYALLLDAASMSPAGALSLRLFDDEEGPVKSEF